MQVCLWVRGLLEGVTHPSVQLERLNASNAMWSGCGCCVCRVSPPRASMLSSRVGRQGLVELGGQLIGGREGALGWLARSWKAQDGGQARSHTNTFLGLPSPAPGTTWPNLPVSEAHGSLGQALGHQRASPEPRLPPPRLPSQLPVDRADLASPAGSAACVRLNRNKHRDLPARAAGGGAGQGDGQGRDEHGLRPIHLPQWVHRRGEISPRQKDWLGKLWWYLPGHKHHEWGGGEISEWCYLVSI